MPHTRHRELAHMVDTGQTEQLLATVSVHEIAHAWCEYHLVEHEASGLDDDLADDADWWAVEFFLGVVAITPESRRAALLALVECAAANKALLEMIGAGPLEDWIERIDADTLAWIEHQATLSESFRVALRSVRLPHELADDIRVRFNRAAGFPPERWLKYDP